MQMKPYYGLLHLEISYFLTFVSAFKSWLSAKDIFFVQFLYHIFHFYSTRLQPGEPDTSIWVGDLTPEVDDFALYNYFTQRYQTVRCAKVVLDDGGFSKGYGFVRFGSEGEQQHALAHMSGEVGLGSKPIKVSMANQKNRGAVVGHGGHQNGAAGSAPGATWAATLDVQVNVSTVSNFHGVN